MARAIDGDLLVDYIRKIDMPFETKITVICTVNTMPTIDPVKDGYVPIEVVKQIQWERDIAMSYLEEAGIGFGEKAEIKRVVHGHWIEDTVSCGNPFDPYKEDYMDVIICSKCSTYYDISNRTNYCSNCGTQMDGEADE